MVPSTASWKRTKLGNVVSLRTGKLDSNAAVKNGEYPFFTCSSETLRTNTYSFDTEAVLLAGNNADGVYSIKYFQGKFDVYQRTYVIRSLDQSMLSNHFLYYALKPQAEMLQSISTGAATQFLTLTILRNLDLDLPPLATQKRIVSVLSPYDDLIDNNHRRIKILEEMARTTYREWFVHFRFPGHEKVKKVNSSLGKIPEGWGVKKFTEAVHISPIEKIPKETKKPYVAMEGLSISSMLITPTEIRTGSNGSKFRNGDTLFARITPCLENGKTGFVQFLPTDDDIGLGSTEFIVFRAKSVSPEYVYLLARQEDFRGLAIKSMSGASGRQRVDPGCFEKYSIAQPDNVTLESFSASIRPIFREIYVLDRRNELLRVTRDMLLRKLISRELDVSEIDINGREVMS
jgi:type I restriction enzyme S subunit